MTSRLKQRIGKLEQSAPGNISRMSDEKLRAEIDEMLADSDFQEMLADEGSTDPMRVELLQILRDTGLIDGGFL